VPKNQAGAASQLSDNVYDVVNYAGDTAEGILTNIPKIASSAADKVAAAYSSVDEKLGGILPGGSANVVTPAVVKSVKSGASKAKEAVTSAASKVSSAVSSAVSSSASKVSSTASSVAAAAKSAVSTAVTKVSNVASSVAKKVSSWFKW